MTFGTRQATVSKPFRFQLARNPTKIYNHFHNPNDMSPEIMQLRSLHDAMDRAVLDAYGFLDLSPVAEFLLEFEEDENDKSESGRQRPMKYGYRWQIRRA